MTNIFDTFKISQLLCFVRSDYHFVLYNYILSIVEIYEFISIV